MASRRYGRVPSVAVGRGDGAGGYVTAGILGQARGDRPGESGRVVGADQGEVDHLGDGGGDFAVGDRHREAVADRRLQRLDAGVIRGVGENAGAGVKGERSVAGGLGDGPASRDAGYAVGFGVAAIRVGGIQVPVHHAEGVVAGGIGDGRRGAGLAHRRGEGGSVGVPPRVREDRRVVGRAAGDRVGRGEGTGVRHRAEGGAVLGSYALGLIDEQPRVEVGVAAVEDGEADLVGARLTGREPDHLPPRGAVAPGREVAGVGVRGAQDRHLAVAGVRGGGRAHRDLHRGIGRGGGIDEGGDGAVVPRHVVGGDVVPCHGELFAGGQSDGFVDIGYVRRLIAAREMGRDVGSARGPHPHFGEQAVAVYPVGEFAPGAARRKGGHLGAVRLYDPGVTRSRVERRARADGGVVVRPAGQAAFEAGIRGRRKQPLEQLGALGVDQRRGLDDAGPSFQRPVAAQACRPGRVRGRRHVGAGRLRQRVDECLAHRPGGDVAAVEQDVGVGGEVRADVRERRRLLDQRRLVDDRIADHQLAGFAVAHDVNGVDVATPLKVIVDLGQAGGGCVEADHLDFRRQTGKNV